MIASIHSIIADNIFLCFRLTANHHPLPSDYHVISRQWSRLTTETVESTSLALESVDNIKRCNSLTLCVLSVGDSVADDRLEEGLEDTAGLFVDHWTELEAMRCTKRELTGRDTLDTTTTSKTTDGGLCDTLDVVTKNLAMTLGTTLSEAFAAFSAC
jgi:hypothetical protein